MHAQMCFIGVKIDILYGRIASFFCDFCVRTSRCRHRVDLAESFRTAASPSQTDVWGPSYGHKRGLIVETLFAHVGAALFK